MLVALYYRSHFFKRLLFYFYVPMKEVREKKIFLLEFRFSKKRNCSRIG